MKDNKNPFVSAGAAVALAIILFASVALTAARAQTFTVLYNFGFDPHSPYLGPIAQGRDGNLYATTIYGGSTGSGTVFKITPAGTFTVLSDLGGNYGSYPYGGLTLGRDGNFYGTTSSGGRGAFGTVFQVTPDGTIRVLYSFSDDSNGSSPDVPPIQGADGQLYGTTSGSACPPSCGTIFKISSASHLTTLYQFTGGDDGCCPDAPLLQATDGRSYGTTRAANTRAGGAFKISPSGTFTSLGSLPGESLAPLMEGSNGHFYGDTLYGGIRNWGTLFEMNRTGKTRVLHSFKSAYDGANPFGGLVQATDGNFYGTTAYGMLGYGTLYRLTPAGEFSLLHTFDGLLASNPTTTLFQHTNGILYGTTDYGGTYDYGTFYSLDIGAAPFVRLVTTFGKLGQTIGILGQGFTGTTDVSFNGIPATFTVSSDTYLEATVPAGATTGFVTVTTSTGTLTSNQPIQVRQ